MPNNTKFVYSAGCDAANPKIGDTRTSWKSLEATKSNVLETISVLGRPQSNGTINIELAWKGQVDLMTKLDERMASRKNSQTCCRVLFVAALASSAISILFLIAA